MEDDGWDLQAVVRGCCGPAKLAATTTAAAASAGLFSPFPSVNPQESKGEEYEDDRAVSFPDPFAAETAAALHDLEELCKPFFFESPPQQEQQRQQHLLSPQKTPPPFPAIPLLPTCALGAPAMPVPQQQLRQPQHRPLPQTSRSKRRKNQQKRVVCQVPADGLSSDMWAWRKYGQKPIKGSPYPRGYYRCSSSKGCLARKQVERSRMDPGMFIITYTAEHNHPMPTHRNSLAGSTRQKFPAPSATGTQQANAGVGGEPDAAAGRKITSSSPLSSPTAAGLSPRTPLTSSMEDEMLLRRQEDGEEEVEEERGEDEVDLLMVGDMEVLGEDDVLFTDLGELRDGEGDDLPDHFGAFPSPWMASGAATAAGGS